MPRSRRPDGATHRIRWGTSPESPRGSASCEQLPGVDSNHHDLINSQACFPYITGDRRPENSDVTGHVAEWQKPRWAGRENGADFVQAGAEEGLSGLSARIWAKSSMSPAARAAGSLVASHPASSRARAPIAGSAKARSTAN